MRRFHVILLSAVLLLTGCGIRRPSPGTPFSSEDQSTAATETPPSNRTDPFTESPLDPDAPTGSISQRAAALEAALGIEIAFAAPLPQILSTELEVCKDPDRLSSSLDLLQRMLCVYPEDFFKALTKDEAFRSFRIILCGSIRAQGRSTGGLFTIQGGHMILALDVTQALMEDRIHHELSHAIEAALQEALPASHPLYTDFGPGGYLNSYEGYEGSEAFTYVGESDPGRVYYLTSYAKTFPQEDRAILFALLMESPDSPAFSSPHLRNKLKQYLNAISEGLDLKDTPPLWHTHLDAVLEKWA